MSDNANDKWVKVDDGQGDPYFYNPVTNKSVDNLPAGASLATGSVGQEEKLNESDNRITEWLYLGKNNNGVDEWRNISETRTEVIVNKKPSDWHKAKEKDGKIYYYDDKEVIDDGEYTHSENPEFEYDDTTEKEKANVILDYNPTRISKEQVREYFDKLKDANNDVDENNVKILPFPLPDFIDKAREENDLKTYNIHYINGIYSNPKIFEEKITELQTSIKGKREKAPDVIPIITAIGRYKELLETIIKKEYLYFPHIEYTAEGCFLLQEVNPGERKKNRSSEDAEGAEDDPIKYKIVGYTEPTYTTSNKYTISGSTFSTKEMREEYKKGQPEDQFFYKIKFHSCIGECGIIQLQYLLIQNIMTIPKSGKDGKYNTSDFEADLSKSNAILVINSGKRIGSDEVINPDPEVEEYLNIFEKKNDEGKNAEDAIVTLSNMIKKENQEGVNFSVMFDNNYRRNILEMLFFYSDARNSKIEDLKPANIYMPGVVQQIFNEIDKHVRESLPALPYRSYGDLSFLPTEQQKGGSNKPKKISMFLDRLKRMYNRYVRRNNKKSKKRRPMKQNTRRKKKNGNKKSKKN